MPADMKLRLQGAGLEPTSIEKIEAQPFEVKVHADDFQIQQVSGEAKIESKLTNGRLKIDITPVFNFDINIDFDLFSATQRPEDKFIELGLTEGQAIKVVKLIEKELKDSIDDVDLDNVVPILDQSSVRAGFDADEVEIDPQITIEPQFQIPLPQFTVPTIKPRFNLKDLKINDINLQENTTLKSNGIDLSGLRLDDFEVTTRAPEPISLDEAEVANFRVMPISIPVFTLSNLKSEITVPRLGSQEIPIDIVSTDGRADIDLPLLDRRITVEPSIEFSVLWASVRISIEFGFILKITLLYVWAITLLRVSIKLKNAFLNKIVIAISVGSLTFTKVKLGLLKFTRLLYAKI